MTDSQIPPPRLMSRAQIVSFHRDLQPLEDAQPAAASRSGSTSRTGRYIRSGPAPLPARELQLRLTSRPLRRRQSFPLPLGDTLAENDATAILAPAGVSLDPEHTSKPTSGANVTVSSSPSVRLFFCVCASPFLARRHSSSLS